MNKTKVIDYLKRKWRLLFCYLLIFMGVLLAIIVLVMRPVKLTDNYVYSPAVETNISEITFPLEQKIKIDHDKLSNVWIHFEDESINNYVYEVQLRNSKDDISFEHVYDGYESNIIKNNKDCYHANR